MQLQKLVEDTYRKTGFKVALFSHSLGPSITLEFISTRPAGWKEKYLAALLAVAPVWAGNAVSVYYAVSGIVRAAASPSRCVAGLQCGAEIEAHAHTLYHLALCSRASRPGVVVVVLEPPRRSRGGSSEKS